jgi:hypothetical protein
MPTIKAFHSSGEWDQPVALLKANIARMRSAGRTLGTRTEATRREAHNALTSNEGAGAHWGVYHPPSDFTDGYVDTAVEWDQNVWAREDAYLLTLNSERLHTVKGFLLPPSTMPVVVLKHVETKRMVLLGAFHLQLANTAARRDAWRTETATIRNHALEVRRAHPGWHLIVPGRREPQPADHREPRRGAGPDAGGHEHAQLLGRPHACDGRHPRRTVAAGLHRLHDAGRVTAAGRRHVQRPPAVRDVADL